MLKDAILTGKDISGIEEISKHTEWVNEFTEKYSSINEENIDEILHKEIGEVFLNVLKDAGVFKRNESGKKAFKKFIETL